MPPPDTCAGRAWLRNPACRRVTVAVLLGTVLVLRAGIEVAQDSRDLARTSPGRMPRAVITIQAAAFRSADSSDCRQHSSAAASARGRRVGARHALVTDQPGGGSASPAATSGGGGFPGGGDARTKAVKQQQQQPGSSEAAGSDLPQQPDDVAAEKSIETLVAASHTTNAAADATDAAGSTGAQPDEQAPDAWLYSLIGSDFPGAAAMLPHWLAHYTAMGFRTNRMLLVVHHRTQGHRAAAEFTAVRKVLEEFGVGYTRWSGAYSSDAHLAVKLQLLKERIASPLDWVVIADSDEFYDYSAHGSSVQDYLAKLSAADASFGVGQLIDRVAADGAVPDVQGALGIQRQFPLFCSVVRNLIGGTSWKVVAFRAYLRTNTGNHRVVSPPIAAGYFGPAPAGVKGPRGGSEGAADVFPLTPYATMSGEYVRGLHQKYYKGRWRASLYDRAIPVHHFKWHSGVLRSAAARLKFYGAKGDSGQPRFAHYKESQSILDMLRGGAVPLEV